MKRRRFVILLALCMAVGIPSVAYAFVWYRITCFPKDLASAAARGDLATVKLLYRCGADLSAFPGADGNGAGYSPLMEAVDKGHENVARFLIEHGADLESYDEEANSPLEIAIGNRNYPMAELLLNYGASPNHAVMEMLAPDDFVPPLGRDMYDLLKKDGGIDQVKFSTIPPVTLLYMSHAFTSKWYDINIGASWLDRAIPALRKAAMSSGYGAEGPLYIIWSGHKSDSFVLKVGLPVEHVDRPALGGYQIQTFPEFKCEIGETRGTLVNINFGSGNLTQHLSLAMTRLTATDEIREVYSNWVGSGSKENAVELQVGVRSE